MAFKDNLKKIRQFRGLDPMDIVNGTGIKKQQYYAWEKGDYEPGNDNLDLLSSFLEVPKPLFYKENLTKHDMNELNKPNSDDDWYKQTIASLIHSNSEVIRINNDTVIEFRKRDESEIHSLRIDKDKLLDILTSHFKSSQNGQ